MVSKRQAGDLLDADVFGAGNGFEHVADSFADREQFFEVVAENFHRHIAAHAGDEFVEAHLDRLKKFEFRSGHFGVHFFRHRVDQFGFARAAGSAIRNAV